MTSDQAGDDFPDAFDDEVLDRLRSLHARLDPPPAVLDDLVLFALAPARVDQALARLVHDDAGVPAVRGSAGTRTLNFDAGDTSLLLTLVELAAGQVRLDGWVAPGALVEVEVRVLAEPVWTERVHTDSTGHFVVAAIPRGQVQLVVHTEPPLITPATGV